jgi:Lhr-like helicase
MSCFSDDVSKMIQTVLNREDYREAIDVMHNMAHTHTEDVQCHTKGIDIGER